MKEIQEDLNRHIPYSWIRRLNKVKMSILPTQIYKFNTILIKISARFFVDINKVILKFI